jgi:EAL domain-containing protein (putative c-di-GMP-specific phosphodiesterase class I)
MAMLNATLGMASSFGVQVIAVGIETHEQAQSMLDLGLQKVQGFYFAHPLPMQAFNWNRSQPYPGQYLI